MIIKNLKKYFTFEAGPQAKRIRPGVKVLHKLCGTCVEVTVLDDKEVRRRFRASNYQSTTRSVSDVTVAKKPCRALESMWHLWHPCEGEAFHLHDAHEAGRRLL